MKQAYLLLLFTLTLCFAIPAQASFIIKKKAPVKRHTLHMRPEKTTTTDAAATPVNAITEGAVASAADEFNNLSREERKARIREVKEVIRDFNREESAAPRDGDMNTLLLVIIAILLPPLAVGLLEHGLTKHFWIDLLLWLLFYIPGLIYALILIL
jgi:uncharacterized membrane protein YqaE (UPF0057 family)